MTTKPKFRIINPKTRRAVDPSDKIKLEDITVQLDVFDDGTKLVRGKRIVLEETDPLSGEVTSTVFKPEK